MGRRTSGTTLRAVAEAAGVSLATVSNVVNERYHKMSAETRRAVEQAIADLRYRPAGDARSMRLNRRMVAGILIVDRMGAYLADPYISQIVAGFSQILWRRGFLCLADGIAPKAVRESQLLRFAQTDGICVFQSGQVRERQYVLEQLAMIGEPVVAIEEPNLPMTGDIAGIRHDSYGAGRILAERFKQGGRQSVLLMTPGWIWPAMAARIAGIKSVFGEAGVHQLSCGDGSIETGIESLTSWLELDQKCQPIDCIIAGTDRLGFALERVAGKSPATSSLLLGGFQSFNERHLPAPAISRVRLPASELGEGAAELLIQRIEQGCFSDRHRVISSSRSPEPD